MTVDFKQKKVWAPDVIDGFSLGRIVDIGTETISVQLAGSGKTVVTAYDSVFPAEENDKKDADDNCALMYLNEATLLNNVRLRYNRDQIYTYVANILISVNPYVDIPSLYSSDTIKRYQGKSLGVLAPHIFAIADKAHRDMRRLKESQSIIVSGESGAGKTESQKYVLRYLCELWGTSAGPIEKRILETNPILEAFGNAKTVRNNNSSRFGKFVEIHFSSKFAVAGGHVSHYLLEKSRVCSQQRDERNYHIFYSLCAGAPIELYRQLRLAPPESFNYLRHGCTQYFCSSKTEREVDQARIGRAQQKLGFLRDPLVDDVEDFRHLDAALANIGVVQLERLQIYGTVAGVLHLGNVEFIEDADDTKGGCCINPSAEGSLQAAAQLIGVDAAELRIGLISRVMQAARGGNLGTVIRVPLKVGEAQHARDALAKAIYSRLFDYIVARINECIPFSASDCYIGVLDIAGFEYFAVNSFEQFCINYCNEKLQQFFNDRILKQEQELYAKEGLGVKRIEYVDNQDCIDLIEARGNGILDLLDEESKLPKPSCTHFAAAVHQTHKNHFRLAVPRKSKLRDHRDIRDDEGFLIKHFAGAVCYQTLRFIDKNNDALHTSLEFLVQDSKSPFVKKIFSLQEDGTNQPESNHYLQSGGGRTKQGKLAFISVGSKFRSQLKVLLEKLEKTGTNFVRCIKPNLKMAPHQFEGGHILSQLQCSGMTSVLALMQQGYPSRTGFSELYNMYKGFMPADLARLDPRLFCKCLFKALGLNERDYKFGMTKVFFRPGKFAEFDQMLRADPENLALLVKRVKKWLIHSRWKKAQWCALSVLKLRNKIIWRRERLVIIQRHVRGYLVRKQYKPKIEVAKKIRRLRLRFENMRQIIQGLHKDKNVWLERVKSFDAAVRSLVLKIRDSKTMTTAQMEAEYGALANSVETALNELRKQAGEQERLQRMQEEMERERRLKAEEETKRKQQEESRRLKNEMESKRREEEEAHRKQNETNQRAYQAQQELVEAEQRKIQLLVEQERRDHELALRLAQETNGAVDDVVVPARKNDGVAKSQSRFDLAKFKYAELRDIINTSNDIELLEACRDEFHRRLKVYQEWKQKNKKAQPEGEEKLRAPQSVIPVAAAGHTSPARSSTMLSHTATAERIQRYFRIPFVRPADQYRNESAPQRQGWWYAHFDGQWIARQMELHPDKLPVLLIAGRDDVQMCELSLDETGLTRKRGAEILPNDFEMEWKRNAGAPYAPQKRGPTGAGGNGANVLVDSRRF